jgi:uncharacterized protein YutE (UPF0331/DUF86 family)
MNIEERLNHVADRYRGQGYKVIVRPGPDDLPPFAKDFEVEILATRADGGVLASVKGSPSDLQADPNLSKYAEVIEKQPGWRYDVFVLGPDPQPTPEKRDAREPSEGEVRSSLDDAERMLRAGFVTQSLIAAWAALEAAMRHRLRAQGSEAGWGTSPRTMLNELVSSGVLSMSVFRDLEALFQLRNVLVHGFSAPAVEPRAVQLLVETARRLLDESHPAKQTA